VFVTLVDHGRASDNGYDIALFPPDDGQKPNVRTDSILVITCCTVTRCNRWSEKKLSKCLLPHVIMSSLPLVNACT
jgi:hypothetical protein